MYARYMRRPITAPPILWKQVDKKAKKQGISASSYVRMAIMVALEEKQ